VGSSDTYISVRRAARLRLQAVCRPFPGAGRAGVEFPPGNPYILRMKRMSGFTLIELLVTVTVAVVLTTMAVPSFKLSMQNGRLSSLSNDMLGAFLNARSQAIATPKDIEICASTDGATCNSSGDWTKGWIVASVETDDTTIDTVYRVHDALPSGNTLSPSTSGVKKLIFTKGTGIPKADAPLHFFLCDARGVTQGRAIYVNFVGDVKVVTGTGKQIDGTAIPSC
jgi:type IV fimbrial biogenesis protein FimT